ncbi:hypothetical protein ARHIZOSPH14_09570 [Agromyces rhizosphaerae]|uniref:Putative amidase domain-containing protein n=1 Tax=Agromyces rhizosphaerae TaxID=88374 RepID=A0A9W6FNR7_9MICO|nr:amidase domain-containing protein [Agromyces rhizosphaerae]GLI26715.1 hypothetical protein ARHIZOSPH14_09570 [Agromyces rhizosphaerae]
MGSGAEHPSTRRRTAVLAVGLTAALAIGAIGAVGAGAWTAAADRARTSVVPLAAASTPEAELRPTPTATSAPASIGPPPDPEGTDDIAVLDTEGLSAAVTAQLEYAHAHWRERDSERFGYIPNNDCVNFTSQTLFARGWEQDSAWWHDPGGNAYTSSSPWISSTNLMWYLEARPEKATALTDDQRHLVQPGDVVQFDWDNSGDRDHTGVVTAVEPRDDGTVLIEYAGHTDHTWDRSVDWALTVLHPGADVYYWSIAD